MSTYWNFDKPVYENKRYVADYAFTMPEDCTEYAKNNIPNYDTITTLPEKYLTADYSKITQARKMFTKMAKCKTFPSMNMKNTIGAEELFSYSGIQYIPEINLENLVSSVGMFLHTKSLSIVELKKLKVDPNKINIFSNTFWYSSITSLLNIFDTGNCTNLGGFLSACTSLEEVCYINTKKNKDFHDFITQAKITGLDWDINMQCATDVAGMFYSCNNLLDGGIKLINVPRTLDLSTIGCATSKYKVKNYIETALDPSEVVD